jgi:hypothetical protein
MVVSENILKIKIHVLSPDERQNTAQMLHEHDVNEKIYSFNNVIKLVLNDDL